jgi:hypothetical protein
VRGSHQASTKPSVSLTVAEMVLITMVVWAAVGGRTPEMCFRNMMRPSSVASATGSATPIRMPNHWLWNGIQRNEPPLMQHRSVLAPGSAFHNMKSGTGLSEPCCRLVGLGRFPVDLGRKRLHMRR